MLDLNELISKYALDVRQIRQKMICVDEYSIADFR